MVCSWPFNHAAIHREFEFKAVQVTKKTVEMIIHLAHEYIKSAF